MTTQDNEKKRYSYEHVLKYTGIFGGVQGLKILMNIVRNKLTSILLGSVGMGINSKALNLATLINSITNFGLPFSTVRSLSELFEEGTEEEVHHFVKVIRTWSFLSALIGVALCLAVIPFVNHWSDFDLNGNAWDIVLLSFFVASLPIEAGECSILKGLRRLKTMAVVETTIVLTTMLFTIPVYYALGLRGVILSLVLCGWAKAIVHLWFTVRIYPYRISLTSQRVLQEGVPLLKVGIPYVLAAVATSATLYLAYNWIISDNSVVGLYSAAFNLMVTYAGMVFVAVEADYFPRLSAVNHDKKSMNHVVNQQIDVCVLLMAPLMIPFVMAMPLIVRILYAPEFITIVPMAQCAVFYMFLKSATTPMGYIPLAKGHSVLFLAMECIYNIFFLGVLYIAYSKWGLLGSGIALSVSALFDLILLSCVYGSLYGFRLRMSSVRLQLPQAGLLLLTVLCALGGEPWLKYCIGTACFAVSLAISCKVLSQEETFMQHLRSKLGNKTLQ